MMVRETPAIFRYLAAVLSQACSKCKMTREVVELKQKAVILNSRDNVATSLANLKAGDTLELKVGGESRTVKLTVDVPFGHKFSLSRIEPGSPVIKYGEIIGTATAIIKPGDYVHIHNVVSTRGRGDLVGGAK